MNQAENVVIREIVTALSHHKFQFVDYKVMKKEGVETILKFVAGGEYGPSGLLWRNHSGAAKLINGFVKFGLPGSCDIIGFATGGRFIGLEAKVPGKEKSSGQKAFHACGARFGVLLATVHSYEETDQVLTGWGF